jgi:hypothetical protein
MWAVSLHLQHRSSNPRVNNNGARQINRLVQSDAVDDLMGRETKAAKDADLSYLKTLFKHFVCEPNRLFQQLEHKRHAQT